jgi:hypothetical protein
MRYARVQTTLVIAAYAILSLFSAPARAQTSTTGAIAGRVTDTTSGDALAGATIVATSPALQGSQAAVSDSSGHYLVTNLPPGTYLVTFYYANSEVQRRGVIVAVGQATQVAQKIDTAAGGGEVIEVRGGTMIDTTSTNQGISVTQDQLQNVPVPGRTFGSALGGAAGSMNDGAGISFSGSTSLENQYVIDGVNTTGLTFGTIGTPLINEFVEEIQVITGGYQAEYGRSTGAVVNVVTKSGTNEFHGSAFATIVPYQVNRTPVREVQGSIDGTTDLDFSADFGFDLGGPIIKDRVWFYVGFAPQLVQNNIARVVQRRKDCHVVLPDGSLSECNPAMYGDTAADVDPVTGDLLFEEVARDDFKATQQAYQWVSKVNFAVSPQHQGQVSLTGTPVSGQTLIGVAGAEYANRVDYEGLTTDLAGKWSSKFNDNKTEVEGLAGWHRDKFDQGPFYEEAGALPETQVYFFTLDRVGAAGGESQQAMDGCRDSAAAPDPYPGIENCPLAGYRLGAPGSPVDNLEDRKSLSGKVTQRVNAVGNHIFKVGADVEDNMVADVKEFGGGSLNQVVGGGNDFVRVWHYASPSGLGIDPSMANDICGFEAGDTEMPRACAFVEDGKVTSSTLNWSAFAQDSWQILPNLTFNAGLRYEEQRLRFADKIRGSVDPFSMERIKGKNALVLQNLWAPRVGLIYDPTKEGRSKIYTSWARFYESIPLGLNDFSFSGTSLYVADFDWSSCGPGTGTYDSANQAPDPRNCPQVSPDNEPVQDFYFGGVTVVAPSAKAQYMDEIVVGGEYEALEDLRLGVAVKNRRLGRVLEDMSTDSAQTYVIGNPGEFSDADEEDLVEEIEGLEEGSDERAVAEARLEAFRALRRFDKPRREYNALELTAVKRVSKNFFVQAAYTYSRTTGNYPGLFNADTGSGLANASTQYDLAELLANRDGPLPQDRPHYIKLDAYYNFDFDQQGALTTGIRFRAFSGTPRDTLGSHYIYGFNESYVLPRGSQGRTPAVTGTDLHVGYTRELGRGYELTVFSDIINFFNQEQVFVLDETYSFDNVNPIVGGDKEDLVFAKMPGDDGSEASTPATRNIGYGTPLARYTPLYIRFGARLTF